MINSQEASDAPLRRRPALREWLPDLLIITGSSLAIAGLYLLLGLAATLIVVGVLMASYGTLWELQPIIVRKFGRPI